MILIAVLTVHLLTFWFPQSPTNPQPTYPPITPFPTYPPTVSKPPVSPPCTGSTPNWKDSYGDGCEWYESEDKPGCPNYGDSYEGDMGVANDNCCYCMSTDVRVPSWKMIIPLILLLLCLSLIMLYFRSPNQLQAPTSDSLAPPTGTPSPLWFGRNVPFIFVSSLDHPVEICFRVPFCVTDPSQVNAYIRINRVGIGKIE